MMSKQEFQRLMGFWNAKLHAPYTNALGRRHVKGHGKHVGSVLKSSRVVASVNIERVFVNKP